MRDGVCSDFALSFHRSFSYPILPVFQPLAGENDNLLCNWPHMHHEGVTFRREQLNANQEQEN